MPTIKEIRAREQAATKGPWQWRAYGGKNDVDLVAPHSGLLYIMGFVRRGMQGAEPVFGEREFKDGRWTGGIMHTISEWKKRNEGLPADAEFIAASRSDVADLLTRIEGALEVAVRHGGHDGEHHKTWVIDQMVRCLTGCPEEEVTAIDCRGNEYKYMDVVPGEEYRELVAEACAGEDGPNTYEWDEGIAP